MKKIKNKELLVVCTIQRADQILSLLRLKKEIDFNLVIVGGAEAHLVSKQLSDAKVSVILTPSHGDSNWEQRRSNQFYHIEKLLKDNVQIGLAIGHHNELRDLRFLAGNIQRGVKDLIEINDSTLTKMISTNIANILNLGIDIELKEGSNANFVLYSGNPFDFDSQILLVCTKIHGCKRNPIQV